MKLSISGLYVVVEASECESCVRAINALPGMEVHQVDRPSGRMVVVEDTPEREGEGLKQIRQIPHVQLAELVYHYVDEQTEGVTPSTDCHECGGRNE